MYKSPIPFPISHCCCVAPALLISKISIKLFLSHSFHLSLDTFTPLPAFIYIFHWLFLTLRLCSPVLPAASKSVVFTVSLFFPHHLGASLSTSYPSLSRSDLQIFMSRQLFSVFQSPSSSLAPSLSFLCISPSALVSTCPPMPLLSLTSYWPLHTLRNHCCLLVCRQSQMEPL